MGRVDPQLESARIEATEYFAAVSQVIREGRRRAPGADLTLFKAMGMGIADLAVAIEVLRVAEARGLGRKFRFSSRPISRATVKQRAARPGSRSIQ